MVAHSEETITKFCELCSWVIETWHLRKFLFDNDEYNKFLQTPHDYHFFERLQVITQEYWLLQLTKLHDPAVQNGAINLTIDYVIDYGQWNQDTEDSLKKLKSSMLNLFKQTRTARNKVTCHNDMQAILADDVLGDFSPGDDERYFEFLGEFAETVSRSVLG